MLEVGPVPVEWSVIASPFYQLFILLFRSLQPAPAPAPPPAPAAPPPTYPTQYPTIAKAQYPNEFFTTMGGAPAGNVTVTPPMVAYSSALGGPQRGTLFTTQVW